MKCFYTFSIRLFCFFSQIFISLLIFKDIAKSFGFATAPEFKHVFDKLDAVLYPTLSPSIKLTYIGKKMTEYDIIPRYVDLPPKEICNVSYSRELVIEPGITAQASEIKSQPTVAWNHKENQLYSLSMLNLDHYPLKNQTPWFVINIPGREVAKGDVISPYIAPWLPCGRNRHVFLVFEQKSPLNVADVKNYNFTRNDKFHMRSIAAEYNLGAPIAGNFFLAPLNYTNAMDFFA